MKKIITYSILVAFTLLSACRKSDNPKIPTLQRVPVPSLTKDATAAVKIIPSDLANFVGKVNVDLFYKSEAAPKKMDLVITKNGDLSSVKVLKADITTFPSLVSFTGPQLLSLFGSVETCDYFDLGVNITTQDGNLYEAFPTSGIPYGPGVTGQSGGVHVSVNYSTKVEYHPEVYTGDFVVVSDEFGDFGTGDVVVLTPISSTQFSFLQPQAKNSLPIIVTVDPESLATSITKQKIGDYFLWHPAYTNPNVSTSSSEASNKVSPCDQTLTLVLNYTVDQGSFGAFKLVLKKK